MSISLVGRKCGMTRVFSEDGVSTPVSVIEVPPNRVTQIKTVDNDGYHAVQVTMGVKKISRVSKPLLGHYKKAGTEPGVGLWEFCLSDAGSGSELEVGSELNVTVFAENQFVDVFGISKGKGYAGAVKRHNFATQDATHGNSLSHRAPGSTGQNQTPGRVFKGKKMAGQMGNKSCTVQNLQIVKIDAERNLLMIKGAVPGAPGRNVVVKSSVKKPQEAQK